MKGKTRMTNEDVQNRYATMQSMTWKGNGTPLSTYRRYNFAMVK